jgi:hypothetical protein
MRTTPVPREFESRFPLEDARRPEWATGFVPARLAGTNAPHRNHNRQEGERP